MYGVGGYAVASGLYSALAPAPKKPSPPPALAHSEPEAEVAMTPAASPAAAAKPAATPASQTEVMQRAKSVAPTTVLAQLQAINKRLDTIEKALGA